MVTDFIIHHAMVHYALFTLCFLPFQSKERDLPTLYDVAPSYTRPFETTHSENTMVDWISPPYFPDLFLV